MPHPTETLEPVSTLELLELEQQFEDSIRCEAIHDDCLVDARYRCDSCKETVLWCENAHKGYLTIVGFGKCESCLRPIPQCWKITPLG